MTRMHYFAAKIANGDQSDLWIEIHNIFIYFLVIHYNCYILLRFKVFTYGGVSSSISLHLEADSRSIPIIMESLFKYYYDIFFLYLQYIYYIFSDCFSQPIFI